jgi:hypothetical protein
MNDKSKEGNFFKPVIVIPLIIQLIVYTTIISASHFTLKAKVEKNEIQLRDNNLYQLNTKLDEVIKNLNTLTNTFSDFSVEYWKNRVEDAEKENRNR